MRSNIEIIACSSPDFDQLVAEISIAGRFVGLLGQEAGRHSTAIEFSDDFSSNKLKVPPDEMLAAIELAHARLEKLWGDEAN